MDKNDGEGMEARLAEMGKRIDELKSRLGTATGEVKAELRDGLTRLLRGRKNSVSGCSNSKTRGWSTGTP
jgi:hypothetical protein